MEEVTLRLLSREVTLRLLSGHWARAKMGEKERRRKFWRYNERSSLIR